MDGFFCCKGWLKLKISSFFKTPKLFLLCFQILSIFIQAPMVPSHTQDSPWGLLCEPPAGRRHSLQDGEGASRQCSNPDWSARHAASSIVPLQALTEALQSESVLLPVGKPVRVCLCVCVSLYVSKHPQTGLPFISGLCSKTWHRFTCDLSHLLLFVRSHLSQGLALVHLNPPWPVNKLIVT